MHRIDGPGATGDNHFTAGNPGAGVQATVVTPELMNALQDEIAHVIESSGAALNKADNTQLAVAISALLSGGVPDASTTVKGKVELATNAETVTGTDAVRATTPAGVKAVADLKANIAGQAFTGAISAPSMTTTSSRRYKEQIISVDAAGASVLLEGVRVVSYRRKSDGVSDVGVIAEELAGGPLDFAVVRTANGDPESVNYQALFALSMAAVQSLVSRVEALERSSGLIRN